MTQTLKRSSPTRVGDMTRAILREYSRASAVDRAEGAAWYPRARAECERMATEYHVDIRTAVGVVAALSPRLRWSSNLRAAEILLSGGTPPGVLSRSLRVARKVLAEDGQRLPLPLSGPKVWAFYRCIRLASEPSGAKHYAVVDVWAVRAATNGRYDAVAPCRYLDVAMAYKSAAAMLSMRVDALQAIVWVAYRKRVS